MRPIEVLERARDWFARENSWAPVWADDGRGRRARLERARRLGIIAALYKFTGKCVAARAEALVMLQAAAGMPINRWESRAGRTRRQVLRLFERAIGRYKGAGERRNLGARNGMSYGERSGR